MALEGTSYTYMMHDMHECLYCKRPWTGIDKDIKSSRYSATQKCISGWFSFPTQTWMSFLSSLTRTYFVKCGERKTLCLLYQNMSCPSILSYLQPGFRAQHQFPAQKQRKILRTPYKKCDRDFLCLLDGSLFENDMKSD